MQTVCFILSSLSYEFLAVTKNLFIFPEMHHCGARLTNIFITVVYFPEIPVFCLKHLIPLDDKSIYLRVYIHTSVSLGSHTPSNYSKKSYFKKKAALKTDILHDRTFLPQ